MPTKKQLDNLKPLKERATSEQREFHSKGGKARAKKQKEQKTFQELAKQILQLTLHEGAGADVEKIKSIAEAKGENLTVEAGILLSQAIKGLNGDTRAAEFLRDSSGQKPKETLEVNSNVTMSEKVKTLQEYMSKYDDDGN